MRRFLLLLLLSCSLAHARVSTVVVLAPTSGTATATIKWNDEFSQNSVAIYDIATTSTTGGKVLVTIPSISGSIVRVTTNPGSTAPTDNYDLTLTDENGIDVFAGLGANRDTANSESFVPFIGDGTTTNFPFYISESLILTGLNMGSGKNTVIRLYVRR